MSKVQSTSALIGREPELAEIRNAIERGHSLVTVRGPAGMGKTRIATEVYERILAEPDSAMPGIQRAFFCDLSECERLDSLVEAIGAEVGAPTPEGLESDEEALRRVGLALARLGRVLIVADNLEQVTEAAHQALRAWSTPAPNVVWLGTSREPVGVEGEHLLTLPSLTLPENTEEVLTSEAGRLFARRAARARAGFEIRPGDEAAISQIVTALDGIPLAIELAAARMGVLTSDDLAKRLEASLGWLREGASSNRPPRHRTLEAAVEWSWRLLTEAEQETLSACAVFRGGFSLAAVEAVVAESTSAPAIDTLQSLVDKSLILGVEVAPGRLRFQLYAFVREYADARLRDEPARREALLAEHSRVFCDLGTAWAEANDEELIALDRENLVAALRHSVQSEDWRSAVRLLAVLEPVLAVRGPRMLFVELAHAVREGAGGVKGLERALLELVHGRLQRQTGRLADAKETLMAGLAAIRPAAFPATAGELENELGIVLHHLGETDRAAELFQASYDRLTDDHRYSLAARAAGSLGIVAHERGQLTEAEDWYDQALDVLCERGERRHEAVFRANQGDLHKECGRLEAARASYERGLELARAMGDRRVEGVLTGNLGGIQEELGAVDEAYRLRSEAHGIQEEVGDRRLAAVFEGYLARLVHRQGDRESARNQYRRAVSKLREMGERRFASLFGAQMAVLLAETERIDSARQTFEVARDDARELGDPYLERVLALLEGRILVAESAAYATSDRPEAARKAIAEAQQRAMASLDSARSANDEVRMAFRLLRESLDSDGGEAQSDTPRLLVGEDGVWFQVATDDRVDMSRRGPARRILVALAKARMEEPGKTMDVFDMLEAGWPGEKVMYEAGANRVYVTLNTLRRLGLRGFILSNEGGWCIDTGAAVEIR